VSGGSQPVMRYLRTAVPMWVGTIFVVAGSIAAIASVGEWRAARRFERDAVTAQAAVVGTSLDAASRDGNQSTRYLVMYRFTPSNGAALEQTEEIPLELWETLAAGDAVTVRYLADDPGTARMRSPTPAWVPPLVATLTASFAVLGLFIARPGWRRLLVLVRVQRSGATARATVIDVAPAGVLINRVPQWRLKYEFRDARGERHEGESDYMRPHEAAEWQTGDCGTVLYDRNRAADNVWVTPPAPRAAR
jgi:uncharacterized protein DUF3592